MKGVLSLESSHNFFFVKLPKAPFTRECNRSVPSSFQFLECKKRLFTWERNDCISVFVSVHMGTQSFRSTVFSLVLAIFSMNNYIHACACKNLIVPFFGPVSPHCLFTREWNGTERLRIVPLFISLILSFHFLERNNVIASVPV